jgi:hypothetical protein
MWSLGCAWLGRGVRRTLDGRAPGAAVHQSVPSSWGAQRQEVDGLGGVGSTAHARGVESVVFIPSHTPPPVVQRTPRAVSCPSLASALAFPASVRGMGFSPRDTPRSYLLHTGATLPAGPARAPTASRGKKQIPTKARCGRMRRWAAVGRGRRGDARGVIQSKDQ